MQAANPILRVENLTAGYGCKPILEGLNLSLLKGEICCVIGEEGSGKSTLLKAITQQLKSTGMIIYDGVDLTTVPTSEFIKHKIDFIAQGGNVLEKFTVEEHISLSLSGRSPSERSIAWQEVKRTFPKMIELRSQVAGRLSGGERMILSIACVLATNADFLLLDEPTAGLSPEVCDVIKHFLSRMRGERGKTILLLEHNYDFAFEIADSVVTLKEKQLSEKYMPQAFKQTGFIETKLYSAIS